MSELNSLKKFQKELKEMFRSEDKDFNWGIYRIMNQKNEEISRFIDTEIPRIVEDKLRKLRENFGSEIRAEILDLEKSLKDAGVNPNDSSKYQNLLKRKKEGKSLSDFEDAIYNHLIEFFSRYYQDGDFINQFYFKDDQFLIPYDGSEILLHWVTKNMYYVKSSEQYQRFNFRTPDEKKMITFKVIDQEEEKGNKKGGNKYFIIENIEWNNNELICSFKNIFENHEIKKIGINKKERQEALNKDIIKIIVKELGESGNLSDIEKNLNKFQRIYVEDFFIHKDLQKFLNEQLNYYINQDIINIDAFINDDGSFNDDLKIIVKVFKELCKNIIKKLYLLENMKKKIWEKKKFIFETNYIITLDKINEYLNEKSFEKIINEILSNEYQINEWKEIFDCNIENRNDIIHRKKFDGTVEYKKLPIDTKHFKFDFKWNLLSKINNLDERLDGILIHSENWQALNLLRNKYHSKINCVYIDPPYNSKSTEIIYKNIYKHATWLNLMENRISLSKSLLTNDSKFITAIDENEQKRLGMLFDEIFPDYSKTCVSIIHNPRGIQGKNFSYCHEYSYFVYPNDGNEYIHYIERENKLVEELRDHGGSSLRTDAQNCFYPIIVKDNEIKEIGEIPSDDYHPKDKNIELDDGLIEIWPLDVKGVERKWVFAKDSINKIFDKLKIKKRPDGLLDVFRIKDEKKPRTVWQGKKYDASTYGSKTLTMMNLPGEFTFPKSIYTVKDCLYCTTGNNPNSIILDFFAGSGTTAQSVVMLNKDDNGRRKFVLIEIADYFPSVIIPRIKKILYSLSWKNGKPQEMDSIGGFVKYQELEQYEDALENIVFKQSTLEMFNDNLNLLLRYQLERGINENESKNFLGVDTEKEFFDLSIKVLNKDGTTRDQSVDLIETFNYFIGLEINQMKRISENDRDYYIITGKTNGDKTVVIWRHPDNLNKENDRDFINKILQEDSYKNIYVNSDCYIKGYKNIYDEMRKRLW